MMFSISKKRMSGYGWARIGFMTTVIGIFLSFCQVAGAFNIDTGNPDLKMRWDNQFRYNYGVRVHSQDQALLKNPNLDDGDRNFSKGTVTNRLDILSDFDLQYKRNYGFRVSIAGWYDQRYNDPMDNNSIGTSNNYKGGSQYLGLSDRTKKYHMGPEAELMDAFVFGKVKLGEVPVNIKVGRHALYWGESIFLSGHMNGISYSQMPLDLAKYYSTPGTEYKEFMRPLNQVSAQAQLTDTLSLSGQYFLQWEPSRYPEAGSYYGYDYLMRGGESYIYPGIGPISHGNDIEPDGTKDWGVALHWSPTALQGKVGLYYRNFSDKYPQLHFDWDNSNYFASYAQKIELYGVSFTRQILGVSVGMEYSYRRNMPLVNWGSNIYSGNPADLSLAYADKGLPGKGEVFTPRGNTHHAVLNIMTTANKTMLFDYADIMAEFTYARLDSVRSGATWFTDEEHNYTGNTIDHATRDAGGLQLYFQPKWYDVFGFPGMELSMPLTYYRGLFGNSVIQNGDAEGSGSWTAGLALDMFQRYNLTLNFIRSFGKYDVDQNGAASLFKGGGGAYEDRDWISLTFKFTL
jgi:hypothetical protein